MGAIANSLLKWESTTSVNFGIDVNLLKNRLSISADLYQKKTDGILYRPTIPYVFGTMTAPRQNLAKVSNKGVELSLGWRDNIGGVNYSINGNFSYNKSNIDAYNGTYERTWVEDPNNKLTGGKWEDNIGKVSSGGTTPIVEGRMMNEYYLRNVYHGNGSYYNADGSVNPQGGPKTGMIRTEKDMAWVKDMIAAGYEFQPGKTVAKNKIWYGDYIYADSNNNGVYGDDNDYTFQKTSNKPKYNFGFQASAAWKGFDLGVLLQGVGKRNFYLSSEVMNPYYATWNNFSYKMHNDYWTPENPNAAFPRYYAGANHNYQISDHWLQNAAYVRLKNLQLGYTISPKLTKSWGIQRLRVYFSGDNLCEYSKLNDNFDPELSNINGYVYPIMRNFSFGINVTL